jgi:hypothetical protein
MKKQYVDKKNVDKKPTEPHSFSKEEQQMIAQQLKEHTEERAHNDFHRFCTAVETNLEAIKPLSPIGLTFLESYMHTELLNTLSKHGISFYDFWWHRDFYMTRDEATKKLILSIQTNKPYLSYIKVAKQVFNLYYGGISLFRPTHAARSALSLHRCLDISALIPISL